MPQTRPTLRGRLRLKDFLLVREGAVLGYARVPKPACPTPSGTFYEFDAEKLSEWCGSPQLRAAAPHVRLLPTSPDRHPESIPSGDIHQVE
ncbi:hypothetical protein [Streptomyces acidiscabies]|uniref:Uncharacterized protein n=1 Tax=Streptomyces acidiscabies TaxID=42234 RepID=A0A0L0KRG5_9ACTN|nr:hypothetical protein [Streptomyces acidiscabies]KND40149.1 hypothetical protein IQ63_00725 [Streptomyces acidiscabies]